MRRAILLLMWAGALALPPSAAGDPPIREPLPASGFELGAEICGFPVAIDIEVNREYATTFSDGRQLITGALKVRVTNLESDSSLRLNIPGPAFLSAEGDLLTYDAYGPWLLFLAPTDPGGPGLFVYSGHTVFTFNTITFATTILSASGNRVDICAALE
jgi:hypothetical protein